MVGADVRAQQLIKAGVATDSPAWGDSVDHRADWAQTAPSSHTPVCVHMRECVRVCVGASVCVCTLLVLLLWRALTNTIVLLTSQGALSSVGRLGGK